jgi:hypothetical protein
MNDKLKLFLSLYSTNKNLHHLVLNINTKKYTHKNYNVVIPDNPLSVPILVNIKDIYIVCIREDKFKYNSLLYDNKLSTMFKNNFYIYLCYNYNTHQKYTIYISKQLRYTCIYNLIINPNAHKITINDIMINDIGIIIKKENVYKLYHYKKDIFKLLYTNTKINNEFVNKYDCIAFEKYVKDSNTIFPDEIMSLIGEYYDINKMIMQTLSLGIYKQNKLCIDDDPLKILSFKKYITTLYGTQKIYIHRFDINLTDILLYNPCVVFSFLETNFACENEFIIFRKMLYFIKDNISRSKIKLKKICEYLRKYDILLKCTIDQNGLFDYISIYISYNDEYIPVISYIYGNTFNKIECHIYLYKKSSDMSGIFFINKYINDKRQTKRKTLNYSNYSEFIQNISYNLDRSII